MSGRWELNPLSSPWQGDILPVNYARIKSKSSQEILLKYIKRQFISQDISNQI